MPKSVKTRNDKVNCETVYGSSKELPVSELPTARDIIRFILLRKERSSCRTSIVVLLKQIRTDLLHLWAKANILFAPPVIISNQRLLQKLQHLWESAFANAYEKLSKTKKVPFLKHLDKLFDILACKCPIFDCNDIDCKAGCSPKIHIRCTCPKAYKIPKNEIEFIHGQRQKIGTVGPHQISTVDRAASTAYNKKHNSKIIKKSINIVSKGSEESEEENVDPDIETQDEAPKLDKPPQEVESGTIVRKPNFKDIHNSVLASIRYQVSERATAAIISGSWIDAGLIDSCDSTLIVDHNKVARWKTKTMNSLKHKFEAEIIEKGVYCISFDGRVDLTRFQLGPGSSHHGMRREEHISVCLQPGGDYLFHFSPQQSSEHKPAAVIALEIYRWLEEHQATNTLQAIGCDSTNINTGHRGGVLSLLEHRLGRTLNWLVCSLHTNELPLRHLIREIDGPTVSNNQWSGFLGKMLDKATDLEINQKYTILDRGENLLELPGDVVKDLSTDQSYGYMIVSAIRLEIFPRTWR